MPQIHSLTQPKNHFAAAVISFTKKNKKKALPIIATPLLAACDFVLFDVQAPSDEVLLAQGYNIHHSSPYFNDNFTGNSADDAIIGDQGDDILNGAGGDDLIYGNEGDDIIDGGTGSDELYGGSGDDYITPGNDFAYDYVNGGSGNDTVSYINHSGDLNINLASGNVYIDGLLEDEVYSIENVDGVQNHENVIYGNYQDNLLSGGNLNDVIKGQGGNDVLEGLNGNDELDGGSGNDELQGGNGDDVLEGGQGSDDLYGGSGDDVFAFSNSDISGPISTDVIYDFNLADDFIDFSALDFINNFTDVQANWVQNGSDVEIFMHGIDDYIVRIENVTTGDLSASDFIFI